MIAVFNCAYNLLYIYFFLSFSVGEDLHNLDPEPWSQKDAKKTTPQHQPELWLRVEIERIRIQNHQE